MTDLSLWRVVRRLPAHAGPYTDPESGPACLSGVLPCGRAVTSSPIADADGSVVMTRSGTLYRLLDPDPGYILWLESQGLAFDPVAPVRVLP